MESAKGAGARILSLLGAIAAGGRPFSLKELAAVSGLPASSTHRLLHTLVQSEMVERGAGQMYQPGRELYRLASLVLRRVDVSRLARPFLAELSARWRETCCFAAYNEESRTAVVVELIASPHPLRYVMEPFTSISLAWGSLGRSILAQLPPGEIEAALKAARRGPVSHRPVPDRPALLEELEQIRRTGAAVYEDPDLDLAGVAAPVFGAEGKVRGSLGVIMPDSRFSRHDAEAMARSVSRAAEQLSEVLGAEPARGRRA
jgi:DNA-binding IclR family transcriptional regulator